jgi:hypothetical protein
LVLVIDGVWTPSGASEKAIGLPGIDALVGPKGEGSSEEFPLLSEMGETRYRLQKTVPFFLPSSSLQRTFFLFEKQ